MIDKIFLTAISISFSGLLTAQSSGSADCKDARWMEGMSLRVTSVNGSGNSLEINGNDLGNKMYFTEEHNTVWIVFSIPYDGEMTFAITPDQTSDDWDFMLYRAGKYNCEDIVSKKMKPVRSNLARNDEFTKGVTGLRMEASNNFEPAGVHSNFSKYIEVTQNEEYLLVVDINENSGKGFNLQLDINPFLPEKPIEKPVQTSGGFDFVDMTEPKETSIKVKMQFQILNETTNKPVDCDIEVIGVDWADSTLKFSSKNSLEINVPAESWFFVNVKKNGYTFSTEKYKSTPDVVSEVQKIYISEMKQGNKIILKEIVFRENTTHLLPSSINALEQLIKFMKQYPTAVVEIQGHVNAPGLDNDGKVKKFSLKRAEQIKVYLTDAGIDGNRIKVRGMGNEHMIYSNPKTYDQEKANRRVEIEILSL